MRAWGGLDACIREGVVAICAAFGLDWIHGALVVPSGTTVETNITAKALLDSSEIVAEVMTALNLILLGEQSEKRETGPDGKPDGRACAEEPAAEGEGAGVELLDVDLWLEKTIPLLNTSDSDKWITSSAAAGMLNVKSHALREDRSKNRAKYQHSQGTCGIDGKGRWWRREPGKQHVWYYLPSLSGDFNHKDAQPAQPLRATQNKS